MFNVLNLNIDKVVKPLYKGKNNVLKGNNNYVSKYCGEKRNSHNIETDNWHFINIDPLPHYNVNKSNIYYVILNALNNYFIKLDKENCRWYSIDDLKINFVWRDDKYCHKGKIYDGNLYISINLNISKYIGLK